MMISQCEEEATCGKMVCCCDCGNRDQCPDACTDTPPECGMATEDID